MELIVNCDPKSVLDVGVGFGKYGFLSREYLELWDGRSDYKNWKRQIDGIEVFSDYLTPVHNYIYDHIYQGNAFDVLPNLEKKYDLILLIDVLEHFEQQQGYEILLECIKHGKNMIISTPKNIGNQKDAFGNVFETHRFQWKKENFEKFDKKFFLPNKLSLIYFIGDDALIVKSKIKSKLKKGIIKYSPSVFKFLTKIKKGAFR